jgi:hypothetical protein
MWRILGEREKRRRNVYFLIFHFPLHVYLTRWREATFITVLFPLPGMRDQRRKQKKKLKMGME